MSSWVNDVPRVVDGKTTFSAAGLNPTIDALIERTDYLFSGFNGLSGSHGYLLPVIGLADSCKKGSLVCFDPTTGRYELAEAQWSTSTRADGSWVASYKASVLGLLMNNPEESDGRGIILCDGWTTDIDVLDKLAPSRIVGDYYLDSSGTATCDDTTARAIRVYCYSYLPDGRIHIRPGRPEYAGHSHSYATIDIPFVPVNQLVGSPPEGALSGADISSNAAINAIIASNPQHPCLVINGREVDRALWEIVDNYIYLNFIPLPDDVITIHAITPLVADEPIVRMVKATPENKLVTVSSAGGKVWLGVNNDPIDSNNYSGTGVTHINSDGIKTGPVIQGIRAGAGISVTSYRDKGTTVPGVVEIAADQYKNTLIDMSLTNLNQVLIGTSFYGVSYTFPAGGSGSLIGTIRVPHFADGTTQEGELVLVFQGNGGSISGMSAQILVQPMPKSGASVSIPSAVTHTVPSMSATDTGSCYCATIPLGGEGQTLYPDGLLICKLMSSGSREISMISMSLRLI